MVLTPLQTKLQDKTPEQQRNIVKLLSKMTELGVAAEFDPKVSVGPLITVYRFIPIGSTKVTTIEGLAQDFSVTLGAEVFVKRMPGESSVSITVPNEVRQQINWLDTAKHVWKWYHDRGAGALGCKSEVAGIPLGFGVNHLGEPFIEELNTLPHLLIAGTTGGGKSTLLHSLIASIVYTMNPKSVQLVLSDTKGVEFGHFNGLPHLLFPPATSVAETIDQMEFLKQETDDRLKIFQGIGARNINDYNARPKESRSGMPVLNLPYIVFIIDELADLMTSDIKGQSAKAESLLDYLARKARATGIFVIASTQRPSVDVITGTIKANFPARLTFRLPSAIDSRTVINTSGAEILMMRGDMLYSSPNRPGLMRLHAPYASITDIKGAVDAAVLKG